MAEKITVRGEVRDARGKNNNRRLRAAGSVPVVVYGGGRDTIAASAPLSELAAVLRTDAGANTVFSLDIAGQGISDVMFQDRQIDPVKGRLIHADLRRLIKGEKIEMLLPLHLVGEAEGLKEEGAVLSQAVREVKVLVDPAKAPEFLELDVTSLASDHSLHVSDLQLPAGVEIHEDPQTVIASIVTVRESDLEPQLEGGEPEVVGGAGGEDDAAAE
jgi:large subunit ribosomal protein L25